MRSRLWGFRSPQEPCGGFKESLPTFREQFRSGGLFLEIADVGEAESAADEMQVEMNVVRGIWREGLQEESAEV